MKLLFIFTGGTIGSAARNGRISVDGSTQRLLLEKYAARYPFDFRYDTLSPFTELSENFSGAHIAGIITAVSARVKDYDGIIVTHGTDTLAYTASALGLALGNECVPVCLVSSAYPLDDEKENGIDNLYGAIALIKSGKEKGVFVPYQNERGGDITVHRATRLSTSLALLHQVYSVNDTPYGFVPPCGNFYKNPAFKEALDALPPPSAALTERSRGILRVHPYPGMIYPEVPSSTNAILLDTYHSGTVDGKSAAARAFLQSAKEKGIPVFVTGNTTYESAEIFDEFGVTRLSLSPITAYMKLWLYGDPALLSHARGGDVF